MSNEAQMHIQAAAWKEFPAQELWIHSDNRFWAYDVQEDQITFTEGRYENGHVLFRCIVHETHAGEEYVESFCARKRLEGFTCFASQMRN